MNKETNFEKFNPAVILLYFIGAIVISVLTFHPVIACISAVMALVDCKSVGEKISGWKFYLLVFVLLTLVNPIFSQGGESILFTYFGGRKYTLEALLFGAVLALIFVTIFIWFSFYHRTMSEDKLYYIFSKRAPRLGLVFTMAFRLVPYYRARIANVKNARGAAGEKSKLKEASDEFLGITSWALENGAVASDSMLARGYGLSGRTTFNVYSFKKKDGVILGLMLFLLGVIIWAKATGGLNADYIPSLSINTKGLDFVLGTIAATLYMAIPFIVNFTEALKWSISKSKI